MCSVTDILGQIIICCGEYSPGKWECLGASEASTYQMLDSSPTPHLTAQMAPDIANGLLEGTPLRTPFKQPRPQGCSVEKRTRKRATVRYPHHLFSLTLDVRQGGEKRNIP